MRWRGFPSGGGFPSCARAYAPSMTPQSSAAPRLEARADPGCLRDEEGLRAHQRP